MGVSEVHNDFHSAPPTWKSGNYREADSVKVFGMDIRDLIIAIMWRRSGGEGKILKLAHLVILLKGCT